MCGNGGRTAIIAAVATLDIKVVRAVLRRGPNLARADDKGKNAYHWAAVSKKGTRDGKLRAIFKALLAHDARGGAVDAATAEMNGMRGLTPLHLAVIQGEIGMVELILDGARESQTSVKLGLTDEHGNRSNILRTAAREASREVCIL